MQAERAAKEIAEAEELAERQRQEEELQQQLMLAEAGAAAVIAEEEVAAKEKAQKEELALQVQALMEEATSRGSGSAELVATSSAHRLPDLSSMSLQQLESKKSELESEIAELMRKEHEQKEAEAAAEAEAEKQRHEEEAAKALEMQKEEDARTKAAVEKRAQEKLEEAAKHSKAKEERMLEQRKERQEKEKREAQAEADYRARLAAAGWEMHHDEQGTPYVLRAQAPFCRPPKLIAVPVQVFLLHQDRSDAVGEA